MKPKNGDVFLVRNPHRPGFMGFVDDVIEWRTHSDKTHVIGYLDGFLYQDTIWREQGKLHTGVKITLYTDEQVAGCERRSLVDPLSENDVWAMVRFGNWQWKRGFPYNEVMLVAFFLVYPLRGLLEKIHWVPFRKSIDFVCSAFWAEMLALVGRETIPGTDPTEIVPGDFDVSPLYAE